MLPSELDTALFTWIWTIVNPGVTAPTTIEDASNLPAGYVPVIWTYSDGVRPLIPYLTIDKIDEKRIGWPTKSLTFLQTIAGVPTAVQRVKLDKDVTISIQGYGESDLTRIYDLADKLILDETQELLNSLGLAFRELQGPQNIPIIIDDSSENRDSLTIVFGIAIEIIAQPGWVETIVIDDQVAPPV